MTNKEAINFLKSEKEATRELATTCNDKIDYFKKHEEAYDIAIKSLEAWEKVKEEIETEIKAYDKQVIFHRGVRIGLKLADQFIDKYLKEVSE